MRYDRAAILTDLDGTLFNSKGEVSPGVGFSPSVRGGNPTTPGGTCQTCP